MCSGWVGEFFPGEETFSVLTVMKKTIEQFGVPEVLYLDQAGGLHRCVSDPDSAFYINNMLDPGQLKKMTSELKELLASLSPEERREMLLKAQLKASQVSKEFYGKIGSYKNDPAYKSIEALKMRKANMWVDVLDIGPEQTFRELLEWRPSQNRIWGEVKFGYMHLDDFPVSNSGVGRKRFSVPEAKRTSLEARTNQDYAAALKVLQALHGEPSAAFFLRCQEQFRKLIQKPN